MGSLRRWARSLERSSRDTADTIVLVDSETREEFEVPKDAPLLVLANALEDEEDLYREYPWMKPILPRLHQLVYRGNGSPFFLEDMTWSGKAASNTMQEGYEK